MAERDRTTDATQRRDYRDQDDLALLERADSSSNFDGDLDDGATAAEDSGAGSFLDRFVPPRPRPG